MNNKIYDIAIIGAGVVGCAIAREFAKFDLSIALIDSANDVGEGTSKANTAILHTGFDMVPNSLESKLVSRGYLLLKNYADAVQIATEPLGGLLVAWSEDEFSNLPKLKERAEANGYFDAEIIASSAVYQAEPHLGEGVLGALSIPGEWIIDPWSTTLAFATQAKLAGVDLLLERKIEKVISSQLHHLFSKQGDLLARYVINVAGLYADEIDQLFGVKDFSVVPRRGELMVFDKLSRNLISHIILPVPTAMGKGVLVSPTVFGNIMLGPTAENLHNKEARGSSVEGLVFLKEKGKKILPDLLEEEITSIYAGLRASTEHSDYQIRLHPHNYLTVGGIRSTGLTASMAIGEHVRVLLADAGLTLGSEKPLPEISMPNLGEKTLRPFQDERAIASNAGYGEIICHCEKTSRQEVKDTFSSQIPPKSLAGIARRTRAGIGRCQGFYCHSELRVMLEER